MSARQCASTISKNNVVLANSDVMRRILDIAEEGDVLAIDTTPRQSLYDNRQIRYVLASKGHYIARAPFADTSPEQSERRQHWSVRTRLSVASQQGWQCNICERALESCFDIDHRVPLFKGGADAYFNLQALCVGCHRNKTASERSLQPILLPHFPERQAFGHAATLERRASI